MALTGYMVNKMYKLEITEEDKNNLIAMCDLAIRTNGLQSAEIVLPLASKLKSAEAVE